MNTLFCKLADERNKSLCSYGLNALLAYDVGIFF